MNFGFERKKNDHDPFSIRSGRYKDGRIRSVYRPGWSEDVYIADNREKEVVGRSFNYSLLIFVYAFFILFMLLIAAKTAWLQVVNGDHYYKLAEGNRIREERIEPRRGVIYDRQARPLVRNVANFMLYVIPVDLPGEEEFGKILDRISKILELDIEDMRAKLAGIERRGLDAYLPVFLEDNIEYEKAMKLYLEAVHWPGVVLTNKTRREYIVQTGDEEEELSSLSHILGYTGKINDDELAKFGREYLPIDYIGKMGIEFFWENELKGISGQRRIEVDALGEEKKIISQTEAEDGHNLILSVDLDMQNKLEQIVGARADEYGVEKASAIVMDPANGEILAMVNIPSFDNNSFAVGISHDEYAALLNDENMPLFNRSISGEYPSGSTIKPVIAAAALEEGVISEWTTITSYGGIRIGQWFFPDWLAGGHGRVNVKSAIANSVNTFFYYIGGGYEDFEGLGVDRIDAYAALFGLGSQTGVDLAGEAGGFLPTKEWKLEAKGERWYIGDTYHLAIGQGDLLVTPLQVAAFTSVFANGGKLYRPHFVKRVMAGSDELVRDVNEVPVREDFIDDENINIVREGMKQTVEYGSGVRLSALPVEAAGKTGTAQWSTKGKTHAWFTGFAPYDDPDLVITVLLEEGGEGSDTAVKTVYDFLKWYYMKTQN